MYISRVPRLLPNSTCVLQRHIFLGKTISPTFQPSFFICHRLDGRCEIINPMRMRSRVTGLSVCLSVSLCYHSYSSRVGFYCLLKCGINGNKLILIKFFDSWSLLKAVCSKVMASFTSPIVTAIYDTLWKATPSNLTPRPLTVQTAVTSGVRE